MGCIALVVGIIDIKVGLEAQCSQSAGLESERLNQIASADEFLLEEVPSKAPITVEKSMPNSKNVLWFRCLVRSIVTASGT